MKNQYDTRLENGPNIEPQILAFSVLVYTNIRKMVYAEDGIEKYYWLADVVEYDKAEWYQKQLEELQKENTQLWDTVSYLLKQVDAGIPTEVLKQ